MLRIEISEFIRCFFFKFGIKLSEIRGNYNILKAKFQGVSLGKRARFRGTSYFFVQPGSTISIGDNFRCSSNDNSANLINSKTSIYTKRSKAKIVIGNNVGVSGVTIVSFCRIQIGNNVKIGAGCSIFDGDFHLDDPRSGIPAEVIIDDNVWIGYHSIILKGVHIGTNALIGAGSVVTKDIPANCVAAGNPCKVIKYFKQCTH